MDRHTREQRIRNMKAIRSSGTRIEILLGKALWKAGLRFRKHNKTVPGKPDFAIKSLKIAVFVDGEFWHGKDWEVRKHWIKSNRDFWFAKIERTMTRDLEINARLSDRGWKVIRFWGDDVVKDPDECARMVRRVVDQCRKQTEARRTMS